MRTLHNLFSPFQCLILCGFRFLCSLSLWGIQMWISKVPLQIHVHLCLICIPHFIHSQSQAHFSFSLHGTKYPSPKDSSLSLLEGLQSVQVLLPAATSCWEIMQIDHPSPSRHKPRDALCALHQMPQWRKENQSESSCISVWADLPPLWVISGIKRKLFRSYPLIC